MKILEALVFAAVLLIVFCAFLTGCSMVGSGDRGVRLYFGAAQEEPLNPGAHLWIPFVMGVAKVDVQIQKSDVETTASSKDMQDITTELAINWQLNPETVVKTYRELGNENAVLDRIIAPAVSEVLKSATAQHSAEDILKNRMELKANIDKGLAQRLGAYGIKMYDVSIVHLSFTKGFEEAVEHKQIAEQRAKQAAYEANKAVEDARAEVERAKGQAAAQNLIRTTMTEEILQQRAIEKWDGHLPQIMGSGSTPFINLNLSKVGK